MNLAGLQAAIQAKGYGSDTVAYQTIFLNETYHEICGADRWMFLEAQDASLQTVVNVPGYTLPMANWRNLNAVRISIDSIQQYNNLNYMSPQEFRDLEHIDRDITTPFYWSYFNQQLRFFPYPDSSYKVTIDYTIEPPDLVASTDVPVLPLPYHEILVWGAIESLAFRERDWLGRQFAQGKKEQMFTRMKEEYQLKQMQTSSHVKKSGFFDTQLPYPFVQQGF